MSVEACVKIDTVGPANNYAQISFCPHDNEVIIASGGGLYKFFRMKGNQIEEHHSTLNERTIDVSDKFCCHTWSADNQLVVCTENGEIIICHENGEFKQVLNDSPAYMVRDGEESKGEPEKVEISCITSFDRGLIVGDAEGFVYVYMKTDQRDASVTAPFEFYRKYLIKQDRSFAQAHKITAIVMPSTQDSIMLTLENNQLLQLQISLDESEDQEQTILTPIIYDFHSDKITGLDICLRKQLIATCGEDKSVRIWNIADKSLEILSYQTEKCNAIAFHPSGFHVAVALSDKIQLMNLFSDNLVHFKQYSIKSCHELQFSHGGHLLAAAYGSQVQIIKFWTGECPSSLTYKQHQQRVKSIFWNHDDSGFVSSSGDGAVYGNSLKNNQNKVDEFLDKGTVINQVFQMSDQPLSYVVGDNKLMEIEKGTDKIKSQFESGKTLAQVVMSKNKEGPKYLFVSANHEEGPGSVQIFKFPFSDPVDLTSHALPITRMRISHCGNKLFTVGEDGHLILYNIRDKDLGYSKEQDLGIDYSNEILTEVTQMSDLRTREAQLTSENNQLTEKEGWGDVINLKTKDDEFNKTREDYSANKINDQTKEEALNSDKQNKATLYDGQLKTIDRTHAERTEAQKNKFSKQMLQDANDYQAKTAERDNKQKEFKAKIEELIQKQESKIAMLVQQHKAEIDEHDRKIQTLRENIEQTQKKHNEIIKQIEKDAEEEIEQIKKKNETDIAKITDLSLKSKADLQLTRNKNADLKEEIEQLKREKQDKTVLLERQKEKNSQLKEEVSRKQEEIKEKDSLIGQKEKDIYTLKKKTQELEKFKFVLDYKIKDLKREIAPKETEINRLKELTKEMDGKLKGYNQMNASMGIIVDDLKEDQDRM